MHITKYIIITVVERFNMFYSNKYTNWYYSIIKNIQCQDRKKLSKTHSDFIYYERHHIIPKSLGGIDKNNVVLVTAKEHFILHILLTKMCISTKHTQQMLNALIKMKQSNKYQNRYFNTRLYEYLKKKIVYSNERRNKQKEKITCVDTMTGKFLQVDKEVFYSSLHLKGTNYGKKRTKKWCENHSKKMKGNNNPFFGKKHTIEIQKIINEKNSKAMTGRIWITNGKKTIRIFPDDIMPDGFTKGRK